jgi:hypothetical protein
MGLINTISIVIRKTIGCSRHRSPWEGGYSGRQRWEKVKLAYDLVLKLDPFLLTYTIVKFDVFLASKLTL